MRRLAGSVVLLFFLVAHGEYLCADESDPSPSVLAEVLVLSGITDRGVEVAARSLDGLEKLEYDSEHARRRHEAAIARTREFASEAEYQRIWPLSSRSDSLQRSWGSCASYFAILCSRDGGRRCCSWLLRFGNADRTWRRRVLREYYRR